MSGLYSTTTVMVYPSQPPLERYGSSTRVRLPSGNNKLTIDYTQYIPVSLYDLQEWLGTPCIYVWECSGAGNILTNFAKSAERKDTELRQAGSQPAQSADFSGATYADAIHLAACKANQILPMTPDLPADVFTCCLTSPIEIALRYFVLQDPLKRNVESARDPRSKITVQMVMRIPGDLKDRRTPLGELSWIFTAVTDTIAWLSFPREIFNRLFRQDLLVAALFRNFLLAQRIMTSYHCTPMSIPELPSTHNHPLWHSWDLAVDACLAQLPELLEQESAREAATTAGMTVTPSPTIYKPSFFFAQHLQAFEVWLEHGGNVPRHLSIQPKQSPNNTVARVPPEQLPIVLQVLLSQAHRLRALILLSRFVDLGPWAVHLSLSIGIFPYVQKLLQSPAVELKPVLIFIWARILAVDRTCQVDLLRDHGYNYFAQILTPYPAGTNQHLVIPNANEHRAMCAFILSALCRGFRQGQSACMSIHVFESCLARLQEDDWLLKSWSVLCIAQMWADNDEIKSLFARDGDRQSQLIETLRSTAVEVRAAALYAFGTLLGASATPIDSSDSSGGGGMGAQLSITEGKQLDLEAGLAFACMMTVKEDASPMVRKELVVVISCVVREWRGWFVCAAWVYHEEIAYQAALEAGHDDPTDVVGPALEAWLRNQSDDEDEPSHDKGMLLSSFKALFETLQELSVDPHTEVALMASTVVDYIVALLLDSAFARVPGSAISRLAKRRPKAPRLATRQPSGPISDNGKFGQLNGGASLQRTDTSTSIGSTKSSNGMKRSSSVANALRSLASMTGLLPSDETDESEHITTPPAEVTEEPTYTPKSGGYTSPYPDSSHPRTLPDSASESGSSQHTARTRTISGLAMTSNFENPADALDILEAVTAEDMERLRLRRNRGTEADADHEGRMNNNGLARPTELTLGMVAKEVKDDVLPLKSGFYDWAVEYFREPQMKVSRGVMRSADGRHLIRMILEVELRISSCGDIDAMPIYCCLLRRMRNMLVSPAI